jgi:hypothetical protein
MSSSKLVVPDRGTLALNKGKQTLRCGLRAPTAKKLTLTLFEHGIGIFVPYGEDELRHFYGTSLKRPQKPLPEKDAFYILL